MRRDDATKTCDILKSECTYVCGYDTWYKLNFNGQRGEIIFF